MSVPAADNLRHHARLTSHGAQSVHLEQAATLLEAIDALHQMEPPAPWALSTPFERSYRCTCGRRWPCATYRLLHPDTPA